MRLKTLSFLLVLSVIGCHSSPLFKAAKKSVKKLLPGGPSNPHVDLPVAESSSSEDDIPAAEETAASQNAPDLLVAESASSYIDDFVRPSPVNYLRDFDTYALPPVPGAGVSSIHALRIAHDAYVDDANGTRRSILFSSLDRTVKRGLELANIQRTTHEQNAELAYILGTLSKMSRSNCVVKLRVDEKAVPKIRQIYDALCSGDGSREFLAQLCEKVLDTIRGTP